MKKSAILLVMAAISLAVSGCAGGTPDNKTPVNPSSSVSVDATQTSSQGEETDELTNRSLTYLEQFQKGEFDPFYEEVATVLSSQLPKETFSAQWAGILQVAGKQESILNQTVEEKDRQTAVTITAIFSLRQLTCLFVYDAEGKVSGTNVQFQPLETLPQSSDKWEEQPIQVGVQEKKLNGLLTLPKNVETPPVVILIQGSGPSNMDEKVGTGGNKPFADLAHGLAEQGVATIRYDKRTYAYPADFTMENMNVETEYLGDAKAAVQLALSDKRVDGNRIYLAGHSEGGMLAPKIAQNSPEIKGFISLAGSLRRLEDISLDQVKTALKQDKTLTEEQKKAYLEQVEAETKKVKELDPKDTTSTIQGQPAAYWNSLNAIDSIAIVKELAIPMLILQGEEDFQVSTAVDYKLWQDTLAGRKNVTFQLYPGLNHLFMQGGSRDVIDVTVYNTPANVDAKIISDIAGWVNGL